ncbi:MAG: hypothetical protein RIC55_21055 [Pirellulaceae bacterium]
MAQERDLPGWPKQRLVKRVRSHLWRYGIRPKGQAWRATWSWAYAIANSYFRTHWPLASEIATQYVVLLLAEMKENRALKLPYRAGQVIPDEVKRRLPASPTPMLPPPVDPGQEGKSNSS